MRKLKDLSQVGLEQQSCLPCGFSINGLFLEKSMNKMVSFKFKSVYDLRTKLSFSNKCIYY